MVCTSHEHKHEQIQWFSLHLIYILLPYVLFSFGCFVRKEFFLLVSSLAVAVIAIAIFTAVFYKKYQWDMKEQRYRELLYKKEKEQNSII